MNDLASMYNYISPTYSITNGSISALSPAPPFPKYAARLRLAAILLPITLGSFFVTSYMVLKGTGFMFGFAFFGDPILVRGAQYLNRRFPHWQKILELRKLVSSLMGVYLSS